MAKARKSYDEYLDDLGEALMDRGEFDATLCRLQQEKIQLRKLARRAKRFSEDRYNKWAEYFACKAEICHMKQVIRNNERKIEVLENRVASFGIPAPECTEQEAQTVEAEEVPASAGSKPNISFFSEADFYDGNDTK